MPCDEPKNGGRELRPRCRPCGPVRIPEGPRRPRALRRALGLSLVTRARFRHRTPPTPGRGRGNSKAGRGGYGRCKLLRPGSTQAAAPPQHQTPAASAPFSAPHPPHTRRAALTRTAADRKTHLSGEFHPLFSVLLLMQSPRLFQRHSLDTTTILLQPLFL